MQAVPCGGFGIAEAIPNESIAAGGAFEHRRICVPRVTQRVSTRYRNLAEIGSMSSIQFTIPNHAADAVSRRRATSGATNHA